MKHHQEAVVETEKETEKFNSEKRVNQFVLLCVHYHYVYVKKSL